jgi:hypothetical protein
MTNLFDRGPESGLTSFVGEVQELVFPRVDGAVTNLDAAMRAMAIRHGIEPAIGQLVSVDTVDARQSHPIVPPSQEVVDYASKFVEQETPDITSNAPTDHFDKSVNSPSQVPPSAEVSAYEAALKLALQHSRSADVDRGQFSGND